MPPRKTKRGGRRPRTQGNQNLFLRDIPADVKKAFKAYCAQRDITMRERILWLIKNDLKAAEQADLFFK